MRQNLEILQEVAAQSGARIVLAQKAFAQPQLYPLIGRYLAGACASGAWEARLARDHFPPDAEVITCSPAYTSEDITTLLPLTNHLDFNSLTQWEHYRGQCLAHQQAHPTQHLEFGLRINPQCSTGDTPLYDPCAAGSRLGVPVDHLQAAPLALLEGISGLHFHTLCEQGVDDLAVTLQAVEEQFGWFLQRPETTYLNLGGGHWITKPGYDRAALVRLIIRLREKYQLTVYLEPGEAVAIHSGILIATVLDLHRNGATTNALLDVSATAHMPDVLEMPYRPDVYALRTGEAAGTAGAYTYRLTGNTCLAGDQIGDYAFSTPLQVGDRLCFNDMAHYTMVKTTFFNGVRHPAIYLHRADQPPLALRSFSYEDYLHLKVAPGAAT